jgi:hypothetical protein
MQLKLMDSVPSNLMGKIDEFIAEYAGSRFLIISVEKGPPLCSTLQIKIMLLQTLT